MKPQTSLLYCVHNLAPYLNHITSSRVSLSKSGRSARGQLLAVLRAESITLNAFERCYLRGSSPIYESNTAGPYLMFM